MIGAVAIPVSEICTALINRNAVSPFVSTIVFETRMPMAIGAACCGALLAVAGLMMQTLFHNPLAGPSVLGISSGAALGVAFLLLSAGLLGGKLTGLWSPAVTVAGAFVGALFIIIILFLFSSFMKSATTLLIVGLMISYLSSSGISLLNYFSPSEEIRNYLVWGLGSFTALRQSSAIILLVLSIIALLPTFLFIKPLNSLLIGERHLESVGYSSKSIRGQLLLLTGVLVAIPTAFCGPIGFLGLIVPHLCRLLFRSSNHLVLLPAAIIYGAALSMFCALLGVLPSSTFGVLPINIITPIIGVPVILYLLIRRDKIPYFS